MKPVVSSVRDKHHPFRYSEVIVGDLKETSETRSIKFRRHLLNKIERRADPPKHDVRFRVEPNERVRVEQKVIAVLIIDTLELGFKDALSLRVQLSPIWIHAEEHEIHELFFYFRDLDDALRICNKTESALIAGVLF